jgi:hypothetical protein
VQAIEGGLADVKSLRVEYESAIVEFNRRVAQLAAPTDREAEMPARTQAAHAQLWFDELAKRHSGVLASWEAFASGPLGE